MESDSKTAGPVPKRLGDLLVESGMLSQEQLEKGLEYSKKTALPLGRVLVMLRLVTDQKLRAALHVQSLMKFENMPANLAVKAMNLSHTDNIAIEDACVQIGWSSDRFGAGLPPRLRELKEALIQAEQRLGTEHPELASIMMQLAAFYEDEHMWPHAEAQIDSAIQKLEKAYGAVDLKVAQGLTRQANLLFFQDRFAEAQPIYERVVTIRQQLLGADDPDVGYALFDLAENFDVQKKWADAEKFYLQSLKCLESLYDCDEQPILDVLHRLSYVAKKRSSPAEQVLIGTLLTECGLVEADKIPEALAFSKEKGVPLARALVMLNYLSEDEMKPVLHVHLLIKSNLLPAQIAFRVLKLRSFKGISLEDAISMVGWKMAGRHYELGELFRISDDLLEAERTLPPDDAQIAALCARMAELYENYERYGDAEFMYKRSIALLENSLHDTDGLVLMLDRIGQVYVKQHKLDMAESVWTRSLDLRLEHMGEDSADLSSCYLNLAKLKLETNEGEAAIAQLNKALPIAEKHYGQNHIEVANIVEQLAIAYCALGNHVRAEPLFWQAYQIKREHMDVRSDEIISLLTKLAEMYNKDGKYTMADSVLVLFQPDQTFGML